MSNTQKPEELAVNIVAKTDGLPEGLNQASQVVQTAVQSMREKFDGLGGAFEALKGRWMEISALFAGGAFFKEAVSETTKWTVETQKLARILGTTSEEASILKVALGDVHVEADTYARAVQRVAMQTAQGGDAFERLGIKTRDASGNLRPAQEVMQDIIRRLNEFKQGADRNAAGAAIFGRSWGELQGILRLSDEAISEAKRKAEELGLVVGPEGASRVAEYRAAMNDVEDVFQGIKVTVGRELLPVLTDLGNWFAGTGQNQVNVFQTLVRGLVTAFYTVKFAVQAMASGIYTQVVLVGQSIVGLGESFSLVTQGRFSEAAEAFRNLCEANKRETAAMKLSVGENFEALGDKLVDVWNPGLNTMNQVRKASTGGDDHLADKPDEEKARKAAQQALEAWRLDLERFAQDSGQIFGLSKKQELDFWQSKVDAAKALGKSAYLPVLKEINRLQRDVNRERFDAELADLKFQMELARDNGQERLQLAQMIEAKIAQAYGASSKQAQDAARDRVRVEREVAQEILRVEESIQETTRSFRTAELDAQRDLLAHKVTMGEITAEEQVLGERRLMEERMAGERAFLEWQLANSAKTLEDRAKLNEQILLLDQKKNLELAASARKMVEVQKQEADAFWAPMRQGFENFVQGMLNGSTSWTQAWRNILQTTGRFFDQIVTKMVTSWVTGENTKTLATQLGTVKRVAMESAAALKKVALWVWEGLKYVAIEGWKAAAGAFQAIVSIPYVGPFLAPAAAAAALAAVVGMGAKISSAAGGMGRVPFDQVAMIHKDETVLPAHLAQGFRDMIDGGGGGRGEVHHHHYTIQALDSQSFESALSRNPGALQKVASTMARNGRSLGGRP